MQIQELMILQKERIQQNNHKYKEQQKVAKLEKERLLAEKAFEHEEKVKQLNDKNKILEEESQQLRHENNKNEEKRKEGKNQALKNTQQAKAARTAQRAAFLERTHAINRVIAKNEELLALRNEFDDFKKQKSDQFEDLREGVKKQKSITAVVCTFFAF